MDWWKHEAAPDQSRPIVQDKSIIEWLLLFATAAASTVDRMIGLTLFSPLDEKQASIMVLARIDTIIIIIIGGGVDMCSSGLYLLLGLTAAVGNAGGPPLTIGY